MAANFPTRLLYLAVSESFSCLVLLNSSCSDWISSSPFLEDLVTPFEVVLPFIIFVGAGLELLLELPLLSIDSRI